MLTAVTVSVSGNATLLDAIMTLHASAPLGGLPPARARQCRAGMFVQDQKV